MDCEKLDKLYKETGTLLNNCNDYLDSESTEYLTISNHLISIMKEVNLARIKLITNNPTKND